MQWWLRGRWICRAVGELEKVECVGEGGSDVVFDKPLKALHDEGSECYGSVVIQFSYFPFLGHRDDSGHLEAGSQDNHIFTISLISSKSINQHIFGLI